MAPAIASSSSSQSSRESWQPSQEANFQTASFGLRAGAISNLPQGEQTTEPGVGRNRPVPADEGSPELAVAAMADGALHVALQGQINRVGGDPRLVKLDRGEA